MNPLVSEIPPSIIRAINARKRPGDIDLCMGEPTLRPDPAPFERATEWVREHGCPYTPNAGVDELRERIAAYCVLPGGAGAAGVCVTVGSEEALYLAIKTVVDPLRDEVLVVEPAYLAYAKLCVLEGIRHRGVALAPEDGFAPSAARVLEALRPETRLVVIASPCNPTGRVWPEAELRALAEGLSSRPGSPVYVLSDEVYRELYFTPEPPVSIAALYPHTLVAASLSKSNALTGLRLGWLAGPPEVVSAAIKVHQFVNTAASTVSQVVALELFRDPGSLAAHRPFYERTRAALLAAADRHGVPHLPPQGTFYCLLKLPPGLANDSLAAAERLLEEQRVVAVPGIAFGDSAEGWLRLSWVTGEDLLDEALRRISVFFARNA